jgi:hypothetical protein
MKCVQFRNLLEENAGAVNVKVYSFLCSKGC